MVKSYVSRFVLTILLIEFLDEFVFGAGEAAWPLIRDELALNYLQIGLLLGLPKIFASLVEPALNILADTWKRRWLVLGGGLAFALALALTASSGSFAVLMAAFLLFNPASGAFVSLSQLNLMDADPARREHNMARWTFAGSLGVVAGPLALGAAYALGLGWRGLYWVFAVLALGLLGLVWRQPHEKPAAPGETSPGQAPPPTPASFFHGLRLAFGALRPGEPLRWMLLLEFSDLMLDVLLGFLALYFVDVAGVTPAQAGIAVGVWTGFGLLGDFLLIPLLERMDGLRYLRLSAWLELGLYAAFLLAPPYAAKLVLLALLGFFNSGWYAILQARLYASMPGRSGVALAAHNLFGMLGSLLPLALGALAQVYNLNTSMVLLTLGPLALLVGLPNRRGRTP